MKNRLPGRPLYTFIESYKIEVDAFRISPLFRKSIKKVLLDKQFQERIMLAVTNVNGCPMCSYAHAKYALESGMSDEEVQTFTLFSNSIYHLKEITKREASIY